MAVQYSQRGHTLPVITCQLHCHVEKVETQLYLKGQIRHIVASIALTSNPEWPAGILREALKKSLQELVCILCCTLITYG